MTDKITADNAHEYETHRWSLHASDLGLPVGSFPERLETGLGNLQPFLKKRVSEGGTYVAYDQAMGCLSLYVWND